MKFIKFFLLLVVIFAFQDPDPDCESGSGHSHPIESGSSPDTDPQHWLTVSLKEAKLFYKIKYSFNGLPDSGEHVVPKNHKEIFHLTEN